MTNPANIEALSRRCPDCGRLIGIVTRDALGRTLLNMGIFCVSAVTVQCACGRPYYWRAADEHLRRALAGHDLKWLP